MFKLIRSQNICIGLKVCNLSAERVMVINFIRDKGIERNGGEMWNEAFLCSSKSILIASLTASFLLLNTFFTPPIRSGLFVNSSDM